MLLTAINNRVPELPVPRDTRILRLVMGREEALRFSFNGDCSLIVPFYPGSEWGGFPSGEVANLGKDATHGERQGIVKFDLPSHMWRDIDQGRLWCQIIKDDELSCIFKKKEEHDLVQGVFYVCWAREKFEHLGFGTSIPQEGLEGCRRIKLKASFDAW